MYCILYNCQRDTFLFRNLFLKMLLYYKIKLISKHFSFRFLPNFKRIFISVSSYSNLSLLVYLTTRAKHRLSHTRRNYGINQLQSSVVRPHHVMFSCSGINTFYYCFWSILYIPSAETRTISFRASLFWQGK